MKKIIIVLGVFLEKAFGHVKTFPHSHIGNLHPEDIITIIGALISLSLGIFFSYKIIKS